MIGSTADAIVEPGTIRARPDNSKPSKKQSSAAKMIGFSSMTLRSKEALGCRRPHPKGGRETLPGYARCYRDANLISSRPGPGRSPPLQWLKLSRPTLIPVAFPRASTLLFPDEYLGSGQSSFPRLVGHGTTDGAS